MEKQVPTLRWFCAILFLLLFSINGAIASDAISKGSVIKIRSESKEMALMKLLQKLDDANPWERKKVSTALGNVSFKLTYSTKNVHSYTVNNFVYDETLFISKTELRLDAKNGKMARLILDISKDMECITLDSLERTFHDLHSSSLPYNGYADILYDIDRPWGRITFSFLYGRSNCLDGVVFIPKGGE